MIVCQKELRSIDYYMEHPGDYLVFDLVRQAPIMMHEAIQKQYKIYSGEAKRKTEKMKWIQTFTYGSRSPKTIRINLSSGAVINDYNWFDLEKHADLITEEEMQEIGDLIDSKYRDKEGKMPMTGSTIISHMLPEWVLNINYSRFIKNDFAEQYALPLQTAMRGGAIAVLNYDKIPYETHIDYHQLYAYSMSSNIFPMGDPTIHKGFKLCKLGIYLVGGGMARLKPDGYPIIKSISKENKMAGADGEWFDLFAEVGALSSVDLPLLLNNYELEDVWWLETIEYKQFFKGANVFKPIVDKIYEGRQNNKGAIRRFYKILNEYISGLFCRSMRSSSWWNGFTPPKEQKVIYQNPIIGIFITAYARKKLNELLHLFPHDKVIGYDTDCVFFAGTKEEVEQMPEVMARMGDEPGNVHYDGIYKDVIHKAPKHYYGWDIEQNAPFQKASGTIKSEKVLRWDNIFKVYKLEVNDEKLR